MRKSDVALRLMQEFETFEVVDCHEHLPPESVRLGEHVDVLTLFCHYCRTDIITAGLPPEHWDRLHNPEIPLETRWRMFAPYLKHIRFGSYARPAFIAARESYGADDITDDNYGEISAKMQGDNTPGIYQRILREKCKIRVALTQAGRTDYDLDLLVPLMPMDTFAAVMTWHAVQHRAADLGDRVNTLDDYLGVVEKGLVKWKAEGAVGLKMASRTYGDPNRAEALRAFESLRSGAEASLPDMNPLRDFLVETMLDLAAEHDLVVAVHTGMWGDFRTLDPQHMIPIFPRHPKTRFDMYHAGMPWVREAGVIGKNNPNVWLNLCWTHIISQKMTCSALDEWVDLVPVNKILAFGGDYGKPVEKVYGHLLMAKEDIAQVLAGRVEERLMTEDQALAIARLWFYENPKELYRLKI